MATLPSISYTIGEYFVQNQMSLLIYLPVKTRYVYKERVFTYENKRYEKSIDADCTVVSSNLEAITLRILHTSELAGEQFLFYSSRFVA